MASGFAVRATPDPGARVLHSLPAEGGHGRAVAGAWVGSSPADRQRDYRAPQANISALLAMACGHGADRHAGAPHQERVRLATAHQHEPQSTDALQFPDAMPGVMFAVDSISVLTPIRCWRTARAITTSGHWQNRCGRQSWMRFGKSEHYQKRQRDELRDERGQAY